jgi:hypothetical protein
MDIPFLPKHKEELVPNFQTLEEAVSYGMELREKADFLQWHYGDFAVQVEKSLGPILEQVARQIGVDVKTMLRYRDVARKYPPELRDKYKVLSWSHFKSAAGQREPEKWLLEAANNNWPVEVLNLQVKTNGQLPPPENRPKMIQCLDCGGYFLIGQPICHTKGQH